MNAWKIGALAAAILVSGYLVRMAVAEGTGGVWQISAGSASAWRVNVNTGETWFCGLSSATGPNCQKAK
jgi:hypothetical protein